MGKKQTRILVVDDDDNTRQYLAKILSFRHWDVDTAGDGPGAVALAQGQTYDAMVLDYRMPGMDGAEVCRRIRQLQPAIRGVFITGFPTVDTVFPVVESGADRVLAKPVDPKQLLGVLDEQLAQSGSGTTAD